MSPEAIKNLIAQMIDERLSSFANFTVPQHRHTGVDMLKVRSFDIDTGNPQGFVFTTMSNLVYLKYDPVTGILGFITDPISTTTFDIATFKKILLKTSDGTNQSDLTMLAGETYVESTDGTHTVKFDILPQSAVFSATGGNFALQLPDVTKPTAAKGMLAFNSANFYASRATTWEYIPTSDGTTGAGTVPAGTIDVIINGTTYHLLHT
jgi:hypothetical protein